MDSQQGILHSSRRQFIKGMLAAGATFPFMRSRDLWAVQNEVEPDIFYKYRTMSVDHLPELREYFQRLDRAGKISNHKTVRSYLENKKFPIPEDFTHAKSIVVMAVYTPLATVNFHHQGKVYDVPVPPQYYDDGVSREQILNIVKEDIIGDPEFRAEPARQFLLKLTAVRSGLGRYGRNNICHVEGMGSFLTLMAYLTDKVFDEDHWGDVQMLDECRRCRICIGLCPTRAISMDNFVIDAGKCVTLYNEIQGDFPKFIPKDAHNALMGCMKCQAKCPVNAEVMNKAGRMEDVTEEETAKILAAKPDKALLESLTRKLRGYYPATKEEYFPILTRNLSVLIR